MNAPRKKIAFKISCLTITGALFAIGAFAQIEKTNFDLSKVPFSRYGAYSALSTSDYYYKGTSELRLYEITGRKMWAPNAVLQFDAEENDTIIPVAYTATPLSVVGQTSAGRLSFYYETPDIIHVISNGPGIVMSGAISSNNLKEVPEGGKTCNLGDQHFMITVKTGVLVIQAKQRPAKLVVSPVNGRAEVVIEQYDNEWVAKQYHETYDQSMLGLKKELCSWVSKIPNVDTAYQDAVNLALYVNWSCVVKPMGNIKRYGMVMSKNWMYEIWSWDHCFNAMSLSYNDPQRSWDQLMVVFDQQNGKGALPDCINSNGMIWAYRKPPIHGWVLEKLMERYSLSPERLLMIYNRLCALTNYWFTYCDSNHNGLPEYDSGNDSGWDNCTVFDAGFPAEGPDLMAYLVKQMDVLAIIARKMGKTEEAKNWRRRSDSSLQQLIKIFWNGEKFVTRNAVTGKVNEQSQSLIGYMPLILGSRLPRAISEKMIADLKRPGYLLTPIGLASESPQSSLYATDSYWRGPVWAPPMLIVIDGLEQLGEKEFARDLAARFCQNCRKNGFSENFDAISGRQLRDPAYTWTSSIFLILCYKYFH